jgi:segregation and condensation protein A
MPGELFDLKNLIATFLAILNIVRYQVATVQQNNETLMVEFTPQALADESLIERIEVEDYE